MNLPHPQVVSFIVQPCAATPLGCVTAMQTSRVVMPHGALLDGQSYGLHLFMAPLHSRLGKQSFNLKDPLGSMPLACESAYKLTLAQMGNTK